MSKNTPNAASPKRPRRQTRRPALRNEVLCLSLAAGGLFLLFAVIVPGATGPIGRFIQTFLVGLIGFGAFLIPIGLIAGSVIALGFKDFALPKYKSIAVALLLLAFLHIVSPTAVIVEGLSPLEYMQAVYSDQRVFSGGVVGAAIGQVLRELLGDIGAIILLMGIIIILVVIITGRSFVFFLGRGVNRARDFYDERQTRTRKRPSPPPAEADFIQNIHADDPHIIPIHTQPIPVLPKEEVDIAKKLIDNTVPMPNKSPKVLLLSEEMQTHQAKELARNPIFAKRDASGGSWADEEEYDIHAVPESLYTDPDDDFYYDEHFGTTRTFGQDAEYDEESDESYEDFSDDDEDYEQNGGGLNIMAEMPERTQVNGHDEAAVMPAYTTQDTPQARYTLRKSEPPPQPTKPAPPLKSRAKNPGGLFDDDESDGLEYDEFAIAASESTDIPAEVSSAPAPKSAPKPPPAPPAEDIDPYKDYQLPPLTLLTPGEAIDMKAEMSEEVAQNSKKLEETLASFRIEAKVIDASIGPTVTRYDLAPGVGVKVSSIANRASDIALSLAAHDLRIEAPIPGKSAVGIEVPNEKPSKVMLHEILGHVNFLGHPSKVAFALGMDITGTPVVADVAKMPHLLIAGATGSGKSVCINTLIASILYKSRPDEVKLLLIDPKVVELSIYNGVPHLLIPVVTEPRKAAGALSWAVSEMESRYNLFAQAGCRDLKGYNSYLALDREKPKPQIVIIIDELADLMMTAKTEVEESICRLAQKARAAGIHLVVATQRPSVDVITGLIKANIPSRLAFAVSSGADSRTILDMYGAEKLLGKGDMLFLPIGQNKPIRVQGGLISDEEVEAIVQNLKAQHTHEYTQEMINRITMPGKVDIGGERDEFFHVACEFLLAKGRATTSNFQRQFNIDHTRAAQLMEDLVLCGIVSAENGSKPRKLTITRQEYDEIYG